MRRKAAALLGDRNGDVGRRALRRSAGRDIHYDVLERAARSNHYIFRSWGRGIQLGAAGLCGHVDRFWSRRRPFHSDFTANAAASMSTGDRGKAEHDQRYRNKSTENSHLDVLSSLTNCEGLLPATGGSRGPDRLELARVRRNPRLPGGSLLCFQRLQSSQEMNQVPSVGRLDRVGKRG